MYICVWNNIISFSDFGAIAYWEQRKVPLSASDREKCGKNLPLSHEYTCSMGTSTCAHHFLSLACALSLGPWLSTGKNSLQDPRCCKSWAQGLWVLWQIATASCPGSYPTAGAPSLIVKSNRHSSSLLFSPFSIGWPTCWSGTVSSLSPSLHTNSTTHISCRWVSLCHLLRTQLFGKGQQQTWNLGPNCT